ncbi:triose-phosphate transporter family-domain-containing protein [Microdochium trichocladiopsis]|uniref:Triose-phosphate transporter family-domain-containing protein n=1 Tax=Microdochium trichocladiopsis TaxID=1682393 RepID=A0A9P9BR75_9PEZI|nr:triose-phosphate transporter family-domain-containing protein [Microdochium trichocladiopsis]KAH7031652.1 triose-phosphate transporter family-domain-containing protein [Microdochium trichocladiopsis]
MAVVSSSRTSSESSRPSLDGIDALEKDNLLDQDVEAQKFHEQKPAQPINHEDTIATRKKLIALAGYFVCNIGLTIYNKAILGSFKFPWLLTALHAGCSSIGTSVMLQMGHYHAAKLNQREHLALIAFSFLFTINIAISNVSLAMVSVPFHQLVRALTPLFTTILFRVFFNRTYSTETYLSLIPIIFGVTLATYGELTFSDLGFILTFLGVLLAAFKTIVTNKMMTGSLNLSFWEILRRMSPMACVQSIIYAWLTGELSAFYKFFTEELLSPGYKWSPWQFFLIMAGNGALAFALNVSSFSTNKIAGALTMTVCANIKQCLTIILGSLLFEVNLSIMNMWGILVTVAGAAVYSFVELDSKRKMKAAQAAAAAAGPARH